MSKAAQRERSASMAAYMKANPSQFPDSVRRPHNGCGSDTRKAAMSMGTAWKGRYSSTWERGMLGGVLAAKCGYGKHGVENLV